MATSSISSTATRRQLDELLAKARELADLIGVDDPDPDTTQQLAREIRDTLELLAAAA